MLDEETPNTPNGLNEATNGRSSLANILKNVEKSYDPGKLLLEESDKEDRNRERQNTPKANGWMRHAPILLNMQLTNMAPTLF